VTVEIRSLGADALLSVIDTGEGIPPEEVGRVFDRFHRRSDAGGSGLGLTIVRDLAAAHGGSVEVASEGLPGRGSTFRVRLPRRL
jgi:two-component system sensor histidine kinase BaeS